MSDEQNLELAKLIDDWQKALEVRKSADSLAKLAKTAEDKLAGAIIAQLSTLPKDTVIDTKHGGIYLAKIEKYVVRDWDRFYQFCPPQALEKRLLQSWAKEQKMILPGVSMVDDYKLTIATG